MRRNIKPRGNAYYVRLHHHVVSMYASFEEKMGAQDPWKYWIILPDLRDTPTNIEFAIKKIYKDVFEKPKMRIKYLDLKGMNQFGLWNVLIEINDKEYLFWVGQVPLSEWQKDPSTRLD